MGLFSRLFRRQPPAPVQPVPVSADVAAKMIEEGIRRGESGFVSLAPGQAMEVMRLLGMPEELIRLMEED